MFNLQGSEWVGHANLGKAALVGQVASMDEDVALGQFYGTVVGVGDADDSRPAHGCRHADGKEGRKE